MAARNGPQLALLPEVLRRIAEPPDTARSSSDPSIGTRTSIWSRQRQPPAARTFQRLCLPTNGDIGHTSGMRSVTFPPGNGPRGPAHEIDAAVRQSARRAPRGFPATPQWPARMIVALDIAATFLWDPPRRPRRRSSAPRDNML